MAKCKINISNSTGSIARLYTPIVVDSGQVTKSKSKSECWSLDFDKDMEIMKILIADDVPSILMLTTSMIKRRGHDATSVPDGIAALEAVQVSTFDVVILDIQMPGMEGTDCAKAIRLLPPDRQPRLLVALTGAGEADEAQFILNSGFDAILKKPVTGAQIESILERLPA